MAFRVGAGDHGQTGARQIALLFAVAFGVDVIETHRVDAADRLERQTLKFALCAVADHRHCRGTLGGQVLCHHRRCRRRAQRG